MLRAEKERSFTRKNLFYYVTGCFDEADLAILKDAVERYDLSSRPDTNNDNNAPVPAGFRERQAFVKLSHRSFMMHDVKIAFDVDFQSMRRSDLIFLDSILTRGLCSLLRAELVEKKGLIYEISSAIEQYNNIGVYYFKFTIYKSLIEDALKSFISVIRDVKKGISEMDKQATRVFWTDNQMKLLDDPDDLNWEFAYENHILPNHFQDITDLSKAYAEVTSERLVKIAEEIFQPTHAMLFSLGNKKGLSEQKLHRMLMEV
jgi:predicted Zn-dependent peptidase